MRNFACWNIRGMNTLIKQVEIRKLISDNKLGLLVINEAKVKQMNHDKVLRSICNWTSIFNYYSFAIGKVWVMWDEKVFKVEEILQGDQFIHTRVSVVTIGEFFWLTSIYSYNYERDRTALWDALNTISSNMTGPWTVLGDFNTFLRHSEMRDGIEVGGHTNELANLFASTGLRDLHFSGNLLTWCNNHEDNTFTLTKLDRVLIN